MLRFSINILSFLAICSRLVIQTLNKQHEEVFWKKYDSTSNKLNSSLYTFTVAGTLQIKVIYALILCTLISEWCVLQLIVNWRCQEGSGSENKKCYQNILYWNSEWLIFSMETEFAIFRNSHRCVSNWVVAMVVLTSHYLWLWKEYFRTLFFSFSIRLCDYDQNCEVRLFVALYPSLSLSVRPHSTTSLTKNSFLKLILGDFSKICLEKSGFIEIWQE